MAPQADQRGPGDDSNHRLRELAEEAGRTSKPAPEESRYLLEAAAEGDPRAQDRIFRSQLEVLIRQAVARSGGALTVDELVQEGSLGLLGAIRDFAGSDRDDFDAFAQERVGAAMEAALSLEAEAEAEARRLVEAAESYERAETAIRKDLGREATPAEIAQKLEWSAERTRLLADLVADARRRHDEEVLRYLDPEQIDLESLFEARDTPNGEDGDDA